MRAVKKPGLTPAAPVRPRSSSTVTSTSTGPCTQVGSAATARPIATPMPLSAPSVVPSARTKSPSTTMRIGSFVKSCFTPSSFTQTMSAWPCRSTGAAFSWPGVAGIETSRLPTASCLTGRPRAFAQPASIFMTAASSPEPRGIAFMAPKTCQMAFGSS